MKILLLGYGKMGQLIDQLATKSGHEIVEKIHIDNRNRLSEITNEQVDVAIDFSRPEAAVENIKWCIDQKIPIAVGTTGWLDQKDEVDQYCIQNGGTYLYASNFSIGVNIFFQLNEKLAQLMNGQGYEISTKEIHHTQKLDSPSGTSITIAEGIIQNNDEKEKWVNEESSAKNDLTIISEREDPTPGTHIVTYDSAVDSIEIKHTAHSREGFAKGAIAVAHWLKDQKGVMEMSDFINQ